MGCNVINYFDVHFPRTTPSIFLAGPTARWNPMDFGGVDDWRRDAIIILSHTLGFEGTVYSPTYKNPMDNMYTDKETYEHIVHWEVGHLWAADCILFWIPRSLDKLPGFTTNVEFGMFVDSKKVVLGYPDNAVKMRYLDTLARIHSVPVYNNLTKALVKAISMAETRFEKECNPE